MYIHAVDSKCAFLTREHGRFAVNGISLSEQGQSARVPRDG